MIEASPGKRRSGCIRMQAQAVPGARRADNALPIHFRSALMRRLAALTLALACGASLPALAQQPAAGAKPAAAKAAPKTAPKPATSREVLRSEAASLALAIETTEAISAAQMDVAARVLTGRADCELNQSVEVNPVTEKPGLFLVRFKGQSYVMVPEETTTGVVKLNDAKAGIVWIQIPVKSMLLNAGAGKRLVDMCMHSEQRAAVDAVKGAAANAATKQ